MTEISDRQQRCQHCGMKLTEHFDDCFSSRRGSFDSSHEHLLELDRLTGELLAEMLRFRSVDSLMNSTFGEEFFALLDARRKS